MSCRPRAIAPMASQTGICEASSKITTSNVSWDASRYCATDSGLIRTQGLSLGSKVGMRPRSCRTGMWRMRLPISLRSNPISALGMSSSPWSRGIPAARRALIRSRESVASLSSSSRKRSIRSLCSRPKKSLSAGSTSMIAKSKPLRKLRSNKAGTSNDSPGSDSNSSTTGASPRSTASRRAFCQEHHSRIFGHAS